MLLLYKHIQGLSGVLPSCMCLSAADMSLGRSTYFFLRLSVHPLLGAVGEADAPTVCFLTRIPRSAYTHYFLVLWGLSQHLGYLLFLYSQPCLIWTIDWGLRSVLEVPLNFSVPRFLEEAPKLLANSDRAPDIFRIGGSKYFGKLLVVFAQARFICPLLSLLGVSALVAG